LVLVPDPGSRTWVRSAESASLHTASGCFFFAGAKEVLAFAAVLLLSWRCSAAAAAA